MNRNTDSGQSAVAQATQVVDRLQVALQDIEDAIASAATMGGEAWFKHPRLVEALVQDSKSLAEGVRDGWLTESQPRIATNLVRAIELLEQSRQGNLAAGLALLVGDLSSRGLAGESSSLLQRRESLGPHTKRNSGPK